MNEPTLEESEKAALRDFKAARSEALAEYQRAGRDYDKANEACDAALDEAYRKATDKVST